MPMMTVTMTEMVMMVMVTRLTSHRPIRPMNMRLAAQNVARPSPPSQNATKNRPSTRIGHGTDSRKSSNSFRTNFTPWLIG